jgi:hypothetical protein
MCFHRRNSVRSVDERQPITSHQRLISADAKIEVSLDVGQIMPMRAHLPKRLGGCARPGDLRRYEANDAAKASPRSTNACAAEADRMR